jgi:drug/metabolite transporter (DMT)-like permease
MIFLALLCNILLATGISANKVLLALMPATLFVALRMFAAGLLMCSYAYQNSPRLRWHYLKKDIWALIGVSLLTTYIPSILKAFGLKHLLSSKAALFGSIDPFVTALYAYVLWQETLSWKKLTGIMIGFSGILVTVITSSPPETSWHSWLVFSYAEFASIACVFISRGGWILIRSLVKKERYTPLEINGLSMMGSGVLALITATMGNQWQHVSIASVPTFLGLFAYTVIIGNIVGYTLYAYVLKHMNITLVSLAGFTIPVFVGLIGWFLLGEPISGGLFGAAILVFLGLLIFYYDELRNASGA